MATTILRAKENLKEHHKEHQNEQQQQQQQQQHQSYIIKQIESLNNNNFDTDNLNINNMNIDSMKVNNNHNHNNHKTTIFDIPIEILFHIFTIDNNLNYYNIAEPIQINCRNINNNSFNNENNNNNNNNENINYNSYNKNQIIKMIISFSKTCKYFLNIFQDDRFWFKSYKDYFSYYSLIDIDERCFSNPNYTPVSLSLSTTPTNTSPILSPSTIIYSNSNNINENYNEANSDNNNNNNIIINNKNINNINNIDNIDNIDQDDITDINYKINSWKNRFIKRNHPWNLSKLNLIKDIQQTKGITSLEVDNNYLYSGSHDTNINLYSLDDLKSKYIFKGHQSTIWALKSDGKRLFSGSNDHTIRVWDLKSNKCKSIIRDNTKIFSIALKDKLIMSSSDNNIKVWNRKLSSVTSTSTTQQEPLITTLRGHHGGVNTIELKDYNLYSGSSDGTIGIWDLNQMKQISFKTDPVDKILSLKLVNSNTIVTGSQNCQIKFWDIRQSNSDSPIASLINAHKWEVWQLEMCGGYLFSGSFDHTIKIWDLNNFKCLRTISSHRSYIHALTSSSFNLYSGSADRFIKIWKSE